MFEKNLNLTVLMDIYGDILNERQREMMELYYNEDFSLAEISQNVNISRQGVRSSIKKSEETLIHLEETLNLAKRFSGIRLECERIAAELYALYEKCNNSEDGNMIELKNKISEIADRIKNLNP